MLHRYIHNSSKRGTMIQRSSVSVLCIAAALIALVSNIALGQGIRSSDFNGGTLDTFWTFVDPRGGCTLSMTGTQASIDIPFGLSRDPVSSGQGGNRAPRIVQRVGPPGSDVGNFGIYAKFDGVQTRQYQIQGIMAIQDDSNYVRCEIYSDSAGMKALLYTFDNHGNYRARKEHLLESVPRGTAPFWIRLDRSDSIFTQYYKLSEPGQWIFVDTAIHHMNVDSVGVYAANSDSLQPPGDTSAPAFTGLIDYFIKDPSGPLPVQLASFTARLAPNNLVHLEWMTVSETNNYGFEVQKRLGTAGAFFTIDGSFIAGHGTTSEPHWYSYIDPTTSPGDWRYRLKQIDLDGRTSYSEPIEVTVPTGVHGNVVPTVFALEQNYPNPFNPETEIRFSVAVTGRATLEVFDVRGRKVASVFDSVAEAGKQYRTRFNAERLTSGVYFYKLVSGSSRATKKMLLVR